MTYKNERYRNASTARQGAGSRYRAGASKGSDAARYAQRHGMGGDYAANGNAPGGEKHCPTCQCAMHGLGGLENLLPNHLPGGAVPVAYQITIYALPPELLKGYEQGNPLANKSGYGATKAANDNEQYPSNRYDKRRAA